VTRDPRDDLGSADAGLIEFFNRLTSEPSADELSGEYAALTMFRTAREAEQLRTAPGVQPAPSAVRHRRTSRSRASRSRIGARLVAAATVVALGGSFAAAAYAEVLPGPLQRVAHQILGFAGVPSSPGNPTSKKQTVPVTSRSTTPGGSNSPQPGSSGTSPSPHRSSSASPDGSVTITAAKSQIAAGGSVRISASFTRLGQAVAGVSLSLAELAASQTTWHVVGQATTGPRGQVGFTVGDLTTNASFRVQGPGSAASGRLSIVVIPAITVSDLSHAHGQSELLVVSAPLAQRRDVVQLEYLAGGQWQLMRAHRLRRGGQTEFSVVARKISVTYRVVLLATVEHGRSVSDQVTVAARHHQGGRGG
jgi:hypothetical protein